MRRSRTTRSRRPKSRRPRRIPDDTVYRIQQILRFRTATVAEIARRFGVSRMAVYRIAASRRDNGRIRRCPHCGVAVWWPCRRCQLEGRL